MTHPPSGRITSTNRLKADAFMLHRHHTRTLPGMGSVTSPAPSMQNIIGTSIEDVNMLICKSSWTTLSRLSLSRAAAASFWQGLRRAGQADFEHRAGGTRVHHQQIAAVSLRQ